MSDRDDAMARRVERAQEAFHIAGRGGATIGGKFDTKLHPHDRAGKFARTFWAAKGKNVHHLMEDGKKVGSVHPSGVGSSRGIVAKHIPSSHLSRHASVDEAKHAVEQAHAAHAAHAAKAPDHHDMPARAARAAARSTSRRASAPKVTRAADGSIVPADEARRAARGDTSGPEHSAARAATRAASRAASRAGGNLKAEFPVGQRVENRQGDSGHVTGVKNGQVHVKWESGIRTSTADPRLLKKVSGQASEVRREAAAARRGEREPMGVAERRARMRGGDSPKAPAADAARAKPTKPGARVAEERQPGAGTIKGGKAGRNVSLNGKRTFVPHSTAFEKKVGGDTFSSPAGTTRVWKNGHPVNAPRGNKRTGVPAIPVQDQAWPEVPKVSYREVGADGKVKNGEDTQSIHSRVGPQGQTIYSEERRALHDKIIAHFLKGKKPAEGQKRVLFMAGGPASGKSSVLALPETSAVKPPGAVHIDPDEIKKMLPEFNAAVKAGDIRAASLVHEESSDLGKRLLAEAMAGGHHVIRDGTGDSGTDKLAKQILQMKQAGYAADALYVNAPTEEVVPRAGVRAHRTGRWVPEAEIRRQHKGVSAAFNATVRGLAENGTLGKLQMYQTVARGKKPILFASSDSASAPAGSSALTHRSAFQVHDPALLDAFIKKAQENPDVRIAREAYYSTGARKKLADKGHAMSDGSFPIANARDLGNAVQSIGRAKNPAKAKAHIIKRAKALKLSHALPNDWNMQEADMDDDARERAMDRRIEERLIAEAADAMLQEMSAEPFSASKTSNWVAKAGGLPHYIQHIAHDLMEKRGMDESRAIQMAIGIVQRWARGQGKVKGDTRAKAAAAVAEWEKMKASAKAKKAA